MQDLSALQSPLESAEICIPGSLQQGCVLALSFAGPNRRGKCYHRSHFRLPIVLPFLNNPQREALLRDYAGILSKLGVLMVPLIASLYSPHRR
jgi:hypothetical protein